MTEVSGVIGMSVMSGKRRRRPRSNLGRVSRNARRLRLVRSKESSIERAVRLEKVRKRIQRARESSAKTHNYTEKIRKKRKNEMVTIEKITEPLLLGEGPHWDVASQSLFLVDIDHDTLIKYTPKTNTTKSIKLGSDHVGFIIPVKGKPDHFVVGEELNIVLVHWDTVQNKIVSKEILAKLPEDDKPINRINDAKCDASGRLWLGTMSRNADPGAGAFYSYTKSGGVKNHLTNISISNGIAITTDNEKFYYIDSPKKTVDEFDFNIEGGEINYVRAAFDLEKNEVKGVPDGMTMDTDGNLWVAVFEGSQLLKVDPAKGKLLGSVKFPHARHITSACFGGENLNELYVTSASILLSEEESKKYPESGTTYKVTGLGVKGLPAAQIDLSL